MMKEWPAVYNKRLAYSDLKVYFAKTKRNHDIFILLIYNLMKMRNK